MVSMAIRSAPPPRRLHHLGKDVHRLFKLQSAGGLQQLADGAHIQGHQPRPRAASRAAATAAGTTSATVLPQWASFSRLAPKVLA